MESLEQPAGIPPDMIPLPALPPDLQHKFAVARADALVILHEELLLCWSNCSLEKPRWRVDPSNFFPPFVKYGVAQYEARAAVFLELHPTLWVYQAWLNFALKTSIVDELAPYRSAEDRATPAIARQLSEWQVHMGQTWRLSGCSSSPDPASEARRLIDAMEDDHWSSFVDALLTAISRRTLPLMARALKELDPSKQTPVSTSEQPMPPPTKNITKELRRVAVDEFLHRCHEDTGLRANRKHIWSAAGHGTPRQFQYWQSGVDRTPGVKGTRGATEEDDRNFQRILAMEPKAFVELLTKKRIIPANR
jgi:hypothetical protein